MNWNSQHRCHPKAPTHASTPQSPRSSPRWNRFGRACPGRAPESSCIAPLGDTLIYASPWLERVRSRKTKSCLSHTKHRFHKALNITRPWISKCESQNTNLKTRIVEIAKSPNRLFTAGGMRKAETQKHVHSIVNDFKSLWTYNCELKMLGNIKNNLEHVNSKMWT